MDEVIVEEEEVHLLCSTSGVACCGAGANLDDIGAEALVEEEAGTDGCPALSDLSLIEMGGGMMNKLCVSILLSVVALAVGNAEVSGQTQLGAQLSYGDKADFGLGARVEVPIRNIGQGLKGIGSLDLFFPENDANYLELNGNIAYGFSIEGNNNLFPYVGSGLSLAHMSGGALGDGNSDTDLGLNLLVGTAFAAESLRPFVEARFEVGGGEQFVISAGVLF